MMIRKSRLKLILGVLLLLLSTGACCCKGKPQVQAAAQQEPVAANVAPPVMAQPVVAAEPVLSEAVVFEEFMDKMMLDLQTHFLDQALFVDKRRKANTNFLFSAFVSEDNFDKTTAFGRMLGDALANRMQNAGLQVIEVRLSRSMRIHKKFGVLAMSQDVQKLFSEHQASFMITGSYTVMPNYVYVVARVIGNTSQVIYASSGVWLPRTPMIDYLLDYREPTVKVVPAD